MKQFTKESLEKNFDIVVAVLSFLHELVGGKTLFSSTVVVQMAKEALEALGDHTDGAVTAEAVRAHLQVLHDRIEAIDEKADSELDKRFPEGED
jgi:hypothetical protein